MRITKNVKVGYWYLKQLEFYLLPTIIIFAPRSREGKIHIVTLQLTLFQWTLSFLLFSRKDK